MKHNSSKNLFLQRIIAFFVVFLVLLNSLATVRVRAEENKDTYLIQVNKGTNVVTVFERDKKGKYKVPVKAFICSTGNDTPIGTFHTPNRFRWQPLMNDVYGQYVTQIMGNYLFHSVYYLSQNNPADLSVSAYNQLGTTCSHGCIRLTCGDSKWIYDNCALGTTVKIIKGTQKNDPLGKPKAIKITNGLKWDPTDPDPKNPWKNRMFQIEYTNETKILEYGMKVSESFFKKLVTVTDVRGVKVSKKKYLKVIDADKVNTKKEGKYKVVYRATDKDGKVTEKKVTFKVSDLAEPIIAGAKDITIERGSKFNVKKGVTAKSASGKKLTSKIKIISKLNTKVAGEYTVTYKVTGKNKMSTTVKRKVTVIDTKNPEIKNLVDKTIQVPKNTSTEAIASAIQADVFANISIKDNGDVIEPNKAVVTSKKKDETSNVYLVTVSVKDAAGNTTDMTVSYTVEMPTDEAATTQQATTEGVATEINSIN